LARKAVVYINSDTNSKGTLGTSGSHTLETFMSEVLRDLKDPQSGKTLLETARMRRAGRGGAPSEEDQPPGFHLGPLGAGSDYVAFIDHLGVASINVGFGGPNLGGVYHSIYDDPQWFEQFADPGFLYGAALSQVTTTTLMRFADAPLLPFEFGEFSTTVRRYVDEIKKLSGAKVDFDPVLAQLQKADSNSRAYEAALKAAVAQNGAGLAQANQTIYGTERALILNKGLPGRDWYRHQIYAPGMYTGYGAKTLPGIREAVEAGRWEEANSETKDVTQVLRQLNDRIEEATRLLSQR
jgi:N-acetylated-alpha-linked acidic dipeptidase